MTDDLMQFLRDRLDEDESAARAAALQIAERAVAPAYAAEHIDRAGQWLVRPWLYSGRVEPCMDMTTLERVEIATVANEHIARHDPARALREVEAKRELLDWYERRASIDSRGEDPDDYENVTGSTLETVIQTLTTVYADHPDYRQEWRP